MANEQTASIPSRLFFSWVSALFAHQPDRLDPSTSFQLPTEYDAAATESLLTGLKPSQRIIPLILARFKGPIFRQAMLMVTATTAGIMGSLVLKQVVADMTAGVLVPMTSLAALVLLLLGNSFAEQHSFHICLKMCAPLRTTLLVGLSRKLLSIPVAEARRHSGQVHNLIHKDSMALANVIADTAIFVITPIRIAAICATLYFVLGLSAVVGVAVLVLNMVASRWIAVRIGRIAEAKAQAADKRLKWTDRVLSHIEQIKLDHLSREALDQIEARRTSEVEGIRRFTRWNTLLAVLAMVSTVLVVVVTFVTHVAIHGDLSTETALAAISLFAMLRPPLLAIPALLTRFQEARVSLGRVEAFLWQSDEKGPAATQPQTKVQPEATAQPPGTLVLGKTVIQPGQLVAIIGATGSGKSSILQGIGGYSEDQPKTKAQVYGDIAYVDQRAWLFDASVKANILGEKPFDAKRFAAVVTACCLDHDVRLWPDGIHHQVGADGTKVSGGQRMRIALARALYRDCPVMLLDTPLAPLDQLVALKVMNDAIVPSTATRIVVVTDPKWLPYFDRVFKVADYELVEQTDLRQPPVEQPRMKSAEQLDQQHSESKEGYKRARSHRPKGSKAKRVTGAIRRETFRALAAKVGGSRLMLALIVSIGVAELLRLGVDVLLSQWTSEPSLSPAAFVGLYSVVAFIAVVVVAGVWWQAARMSVQLARNAHSAALKRVVNAPLRFFDQVPAGEVLNCLNSDLNELELRTMSHITHCLIIFAGIALMLVMAIITQPLVLPVIVGVGILYYRLQATYRAYTREIKRVNATDRSPVYSLVGDLDRGGLWLRVTRSSSFYLSQLLNRFRAEQQSFYTLTALSRWLAVRLELLAVAVVAALVLAGTALGHWLGRDTVDPAILALIVTYAYMSSAQFNTGIRRLALVESSLTSVERLTPLWQLPLPKTVQTEKFAQPSRIDIRQGSLAYQGDRVLSNIDLTIAPLSKIGLQGRTGSGKSSLARVLQGLYPLDSGRLAIAGVVVTEQLLPSWTEQVFSVGQKHSYVLGTVRQALASGAVSDSALTAALKRVGLWQSFEATGLSLDAPIKDWPLSPGESQLFGIARALLTHRWCIVFDEVTSALDPDARQMFYDVLRTAFRNQTVICISHDPDTLACLDQVYTLSEGQVGQSQNYGSF